MILRFAEQRLKSRFPVLSRKQRSGLIRTFSTFQIDSDIWRALHCAPGFRLLFSLTPPSGGMLRDYRTIMLRNNTLGSCHAYLAEWKIKNVTSGIVQTLAVRFYSRSIARVTVWYGLEFDFFQVELITHHSMKAGFTGGLVVDYPNSTKAKKYESIMCIPSVASRS